MGPLLFENTDDTPKIHFDPSTGLFEMSGRSLPEEVIKFYSPVIDWITAYAETPNEKTVVKLKLVYFNSASQRSLLEVLNAFEKVKDKGKELVIEWYYMEEDDDMREAGEEYEDLLDVPFEFLTFVPE